MKELSQTKRRYFKKNEIKSILKSKGTLSIQEIEESRCDAHCWAEKMRAKARRFDVSLVDNGGGLWDEPRNYKLRICNVPARNCNVNVLFVRYFFSIRVGDMGKTFEEMAAIVNDMNMGFPSVKIVLLNVTDEGFGFCAETRCHVADATEILECFERYKDRLFTIPLKLLHTIDFYNKNKSDLELARKRVYSPE